jgi:ectoine hydroxylase-related dioxygenase (phytanoyl-CoA dioxygenase family)
MYLPIPYKIQYDTQRFPFKERILSILEEESLEDLHKANEIDRLVRETDQSTKWHKLYYSNFSEKVQPLYLELVSNLAKSFNYQELIFQRIPTFRVQLVNNIAVGEWHKDKTYNHGISEVNFWMPFTDAYDTNTIWIESKEDLGDYMPYSVKYGEILVFSGANLHHGNKTNLTEISRVSMDFRMVDPDLFVSNSGKSINGITQFTIGGYFDKLSLTR